MYHCIIVSLYHDSIFQASLPQSIHRVNLPLSLPQTEMGGFATSKKTRANKSESIKKLLKGLRADVVVNSLTKPTSQQDKPGWEIYWKQFMNATEQELRKLQPDSSEYKKLKGLLDEFIAAHEKAEEEVMIQYNSTEHTISTTSTKHYKTPENTTKTCLRQACLKLRQACLSL